MLQSSKLVHSGTKKMLDFTQNVMHCSMNFFLASQNNRKFSKVWEKQTRTENLMQCWINFLLVSPPKKKQKRGWNVKKTNSSWKLYIYVTGCIRVKEQFKILEKNSKQGFFSTFWFVVTSEAKIILIESIFKIKFSVINPCLAFSFLKF